MFSILLDIAFWSVAFCAVLDLTVFQPWRSAANRRNGVAFWLILLFLALTVALNALRLSAGPDHPSTGMFISIGLCAGAALVNALLMTRVAAKQVRANVAAWREVRTAHALATKEAAAAAADRVTPHLE